jgi:crotonobetainyl-CoA:carnitine CoA-transferase CaiB-like acyl-CoA transferase
MGVFAPLTDVKIIDVSRFLPGPYATQLLGDLGAEVIKVEEPSIGDPIRWVGDEQKRSGNEMSHLFQMLNRNKKSVTINLKSTKGSNLFYRLVEDADVVVESFRPGVVDRLNIDFETIQHYNDDIIYCSISGYGQTGPYREMSGHDINYLAVSGILGLTGHNDGKPILPGTTISDLAAGTFASMAMLSALYEEGPQYIDISITDVASTWTLPYIWHQFAGREPPTRGDTRHQKYPSYAVYRTADDRYIALGAIEFEFWKNFCEEIGCKEFIDDHRSEDPVTRQRIYHEIQSILLTSPRDELLSQLSKRDIPVSPVNDLRDLESDHHLQSRELITETEHMGTQFRFPAIFSSQTDEFRSPSPDLGEHTEAVLADLGYGETDIEQFGNEDVI